jgi:hypothetical protein
MGCCYATRSLKAMGEHVLAYGKRAGEHKVTVSWTSSMQVYFINKSRTDYFVVTEEGGEAQPDQKLPGGCHSAYDSADPSLG